MRVENPFSPLDPRAVFLGAVITAHCGPPCGGFTPHSAFYTREALGRIVTTTAENICSFARGEPQNVVIEAGEKKP